MIMWVILLLLVGFFGWAGSRLGAVRMSINLFGTLLGLWVGTKFGHSLMPMMAKYADGNPFLLFVAPALGLFVILYIVFSCVGYVVGDKVYMYYKYRTIDEKRVAWETMNSRVGISLGIANGITHFSVLALFAYTVGYWTTQLDGSAADPSAVKGSGGSVADYRSNAKPVVKEPTGGGGAETLAKVANPLRKALKGSGLEKFIAAIDPTPANFYHLADCVGLVYHNPSAARRFLSYPGTLGLAELPEFQAMVNDPAFQTLWSSKPSLKALLTTEKSRAIFKNQALLKQIAQLDSKDTYQYLTEGHSDKYKGELILGRWDIHIPSTIVQAGKNNPNLAADLANLAMLRRMMIALIKDVTLIATPESQIMVKGSFDDQKPLVELLNGRNPGVRTNTPISKILASGTWKKEAAEGQYSVTFSNAGAKGEKLQILNSSSLTMTFFGGSLVFSKAD